MAKVLMIDYEKCTGCRLCEQACSVKHEGVSNPARSRIKVVKWEEEGLYVPMTCQQCESAPCQVVCPVKAISQSNHLGTVEVDYDKCIGCRICVTVCPFGAMSFDTLGEKVIKCDFCSGDPVCVKFCETQAIQYVDASKLSIAKQRTAAEKLSSILQKAATLTPSV